MSTIYTFTDPDVNPQRHERGDVVAELIVNDMRAKEPRKIPMIKVIFEATGAGLKASKDVYDETKRQLQLYGTPEATAFLEGALFGLAMQVKSPGLRARQQLAEQTMEMDA